MGHNRLVYLILIDEALVVQGMHPRNVFSKFLSLHLIGPQMFSLDCVNITLRRMDSQSDVALSPTNCVAYLNPIPVKFMMQMCTMSCGRNIH